MRFFFDNCVSPRHARGLRVFAEPQQNEIIHLTERFTADTPDPERLGELAQEGDWVVISGDKRITSSKANQAAWRECNLTAFFLVDRWANASFWSQAAELVRWWPDVVLKARQHPSGHGFIVPHSGKDLKQIYP